MKKIGIILIGLMIWGTAGAQEFVSEFQKKHEKDAEFTIVNITSKMFQLIGTMADATEESIISNLDGLRMISSKKNIKKYYKEAASDLARAGHEELMTVESENENIRMYTKDKKGVISSLVIVIENPTEFTLIGISGKIDLKQLASLSKTLNIEHLEKLDSIQ